ncbi:MAG TPA: alpha/beta hydrolase [Gemmatimonadaceae bacterium]|nr:alpha/beta hydrolase [Gemmatimonadaceae bacterium]
MTSTTRPGAMTGHDRFIDAGGLKIHYLDVPGGDPPIVLLHGLSANAHSFGGLIAAGLAPTFRVVAPDLRGRGQTDKPATGYAMADHARDVVALLDALGFDRPVVLGGHSFGAFLSTYVAAHYPDRVSKLIAIDAAITLDPRVGEMLKPSLDRLLRTSPSVDAYLADVRGAAYLAGMWDDAIEGYYRAELSVNPDGTVRSMTSASAIAQALQAVIGAEQWKEIVARAKQPAILINSTGAYGPPGSPPLVEEANAREMAETFPNCRYVQVPGNHMTMMFGPGAAAIRDEITSFVRGDARGR